MESFFFFKVEEGLDLTENLYRHCASPPCYSHSHNLVFVQSTPIAVFQMPLRIALILAQILIWGHELTKKNQTANSLAEM